MIVEGEDGLDILPLTLLGRNASTAFIGRVRDELVDDAKTLGFVEGLCLERFASFFRGCGSADAVDPVADPA
jgi:hypothetical protein